MINSNAFKPPEEINRERPLQTRIISPMDIMKDINPIKKMYPSLQNLRQVIYIQECEAIFKSMKDIAEEKIIIPVIFNDGFTIMIGGHVTPLLFIKYKGLYFIIEAESMGNDGRLEKHYKVIGISVNKFENLSLKNGNSANGNSINQNNALSDIEEDENLVLSQIDKKSCGVIAIHVLKTLMKNKNGEIDFILKQVDEAILDNSFERLKNVYLHENMAKCFQSVIFSALVTLPRHERPPFNSSMLTERISSLMEKSRTEEKPGIIRQGQKNMRFLSVNENLCRAYNITGENLPKMTKNEKRQFFSHHF